MLSLYKFMNVNRNDNYIGYIQKIGFNFNITNINLLVSCYFDWRNIMIIKLFLHLINF
jgi:hypothetical protein